MTLFRWFILSQKVSNVNFASQMSTNRAKFITTILGLKFALEGGWCHRRPSQMFLHISQQRVEHKIWFLQHNWAWSIQFVKSVSQPKSHVGMWFLFHGPSPRNIVKWASTLDYKYSINRAQFIMLISDSKSPRGKGAVKWILCPIYHSDCIISMTILFIL